MMSESTKTALATGVAFVTTVFQSIVGFTKLGGRIGIERTAAITGAGVLVVVVVILWVATVDWTRTSRVIAGITTSFLAIAVTVTLLALTGHLHSILITQSRDGNLTATTFRGAMTRAEATVGFFTDAGVPIVLRAIDAHDRESVNAVRIEHTSDTDFMLHAFQYPQRVTVTHESARPLRLVLDTDSTVTFMTSRAVSRRVRADVLLGGIVWLIASLLVWWLSRWPRPADNPNNPAGFRTKASSSTRRRKPS